MRNLILFLTCVFIYSCNQSDNPKIPEKELSNDWRAILVIDEEARIKLPFNFEYDASATEPKFILINGPERIELDRIRRTKDSLIVKLDPYESELHLEVKGKQMKGVWHNYYKGPEYVIPVLARNGISKRFLHTDSTVINLTGNYEITFGDSSDMYKGLGEFSQLDHIVLGTIRTETGDYRFLEGIQTGKHVHLSCFDGSHAFLFSAELDGDSGLTRGQFFSGNHYRDTWTALRNDTFKLGNPDSLTYMIEESEGFYFNIPLLGGDTLTNHHPMFQNKVTIIQIMGTWCPNCKDESEYLKQIYEKYDTNQVKIIAVGFENEADHAAGQKRMMAYKALLNIKYDMFYGGTTKKELVTHRFPSLSKILSYPTLIVLDQQHQVVKIHTGFNGPATTKYQPFVQEMEALLDSLTTQEFQ